MFNNIKYMMKFQYTRVVPNFKINKNLYNILKNENKVANTNTINKPFYVPKRKLSYSFKMNNNKPPDYTILIIMFLSSSFIILKNKKR